MSSRLTCLAISAAALFVAACTNGPRVVNGFDEAISYIGRVDRTDSLGPRQWGAAAYFTFAFDGDGCDVDIRDQRLYGNSYNYLEVVIDGESVARVRTLGERNRLTIGKSQLPAVTDTALKVIAVADSITDGPHTVLIARDTECAMGFTQVEQVAAKGLEAWQPAADKKIEFIGNSITSGMDCYDGEIPFGQGTWYDHHRAYYAYGPRTARALNAQWSLASVSGIGLMHSCCEHKYVLPQTYDKVNLVDNEVPYDFSFRPDIVVSALGQNDGVQDSATFVDAYVDFIRVLREKNPDAQLVLLSSPMANDTLRTFFRQILPAVADEATRRGFAGKAGEIPVYIYENAYNDGGTSHPSMDQQAEIADKLVNFLRDSVGIAQ
ncbi:MAG: GDSL-type esterase/lipase family protein [Bacteroidales bacterium]|nr:GDSL-type esterase/lipase family protein [Bacteroidales bacterium]